MSPDKIELLEKQLADEKELRSLTEKSLKAKIVEVSNLKKLFSNEKDTSQLLGMECVIANSCFTLRGILDNLADAYILINKDGYIQNMNRAAEELFGFTTTDKVNVTKLIYKKDYEYAFGAFNELFKNGSFINYRARVYTKKKGVRKVHINASLVYDTLDRPVGAQGIIRDITEESKKEKEFTKQKNQLSIMVEGSPLGIILTKGKKILKVNNSFENFIGYTNKELVNMTEKDISFPEDIEKSVKLHKKVKNNEIDKFKLIKRFKKKNGSLLIAKTSVNIVKDDEDNFMYKLTMIEDITNELHESSMLKAINSLLASIIGKTDIQEIAWEITKNTIKLFGFEDCVIYKVNKETNTLEQIAASGIRFSKEQHKINNLIIPIGEGIVGTIAKTKIAEIIKDTSKDPRYIASEYTRHSEITVPIIADGEVIGVIDSEHTAKDYFTKTHLETLNSIANIAATQFKIAINANFRLEAESNRNKLLKDLEISNSKLEDYAHIVSHDLKSPLRNINALTNWIKTDYFKLIDKKGRGTLDLILSNVDKMEALISGILEYSTVDKVETVAYEVDVDILVKQMIQSIFIPNQITIKILNKLPKIIGDKYRLQQLFQNLIQNAIKYSKPEGGAITIGVKAEGNYWQFYVKDEGIGIDKVYHEKIFEMFNKLTNNTDSTGIGLSIVKKIVTFYHGEIWVESEINKGSTFYFKLPRI